MDCKHEKDKYGCVKGCKDFYPVISRESIKAEMDAGDEYEKEQREYHYKETTKADLIEGVKKLHA